MVRVQVRVRVMVRVRVRVDRRGRSIEGADRRFASEASRQPSAHWLRTPLMQKVVRSQ